MQISPAIFNAFSFQAVIQGPMILFAKSLGASATVLGLVTGMTPLLVTFQIPAADYVAKVGYRRFVYAGWGTRVMFIFVMALVPLGHAVMQRKQLLGIARRAETGSRAGPGNVVATGRSSPSGAAPRRLHAAVSYDGDHGITGQQVAVRFYMERQ